MPPFVSIYSINQVTVNGVKHIDMVIRHNYTAKMYVKLTIGSYNKFRNYDLRIKGINVTSSLTNDDHNDRYTENMYVDCMTLLTSFLYLQGYNKTLIRTLLEGYRTRRTND